MSTREKTVAESLDTTVEMSHSEENESVRCNLCFRHCQLQPGQTGFCHARINRDGQLVAASYGKLTSLALDPVEKKPLTRWMSGSTVLSLGSFGCNLHCPWCQNASISQVGEGRVPTRELSPDELVELGVRLHREDSSMVGVAYTYNEPLMFWEYVLDCAKRVRSAGLKNVLVSAGCVASDVVSAIAPYMDAVNIDLKSISEETYQLLGGRLQMVQEAIRILCAEPNCHVELTTLIVPGINDSHDEMRELASWIASINPAIPLHVSRFHPAWKMHDCLPTPVSRVYELVDVARNYLECVVTGNC
ncbi:MAG: AmmeMemoRadiSam system radical SAM enzyme [Atopobiaceae bacterium]|nr:AmmeMemoRadiSam system radical SAM enzyme [Atopobiaceae bacterium]